MTILRQKPSCTQGGEPRTEDRQQAVSVLNLGISSPLQGEDSQSHICPLIATPGLACFYSTPMAGFCSAVDTGMMATENRQPKLGLPPPTSTIFLNALRRLSVTEPPSFD
jgi:hypothetical protein